MSGEETQHEKTVEELQAEVQDWKEICDGAVQQHMRMSAAIIHLQHMVEDAERRVFELCNEVKRWKGIAKRKGAVVEEETK
jgi:hypothetical protein